MFHCVTGLFPEKNLDSERQYYKKYALSKGRLEEVMLLLNASPYIRLISAYVRISWLLFMVGETDRLRNTEAYVKYGDVYGKSGILLHTIWRGLQMGASDQGNLMGDAPFLVVEEERSIVIEAEIVSILVL